VSGPAATAPIAYLWGDDGYGLDAAVERLRTDPAVFPAGAPSRWLAPTDQPARLLGEIAERIATATLFGSGTLVVVGDPGPLLRRSEDRAAALALPGQVAPGNGLVFVTEAEGSQREPPHKALADAVRSAGGSVARLEAPREGGLAAWIEARARERGVELQPGAARELATRVGAFVREGDVDRRNQGRLAVMELEKLATYRSGGGPVTADDVGALVAEAIPGTIWGFVDAVGGRQERRALELYERLAATTPEPVVLAVLHRRLRELIEIADRLGSGESPGSLVRSMKLQPFRAETLARQARAWSVEELEGALGSLLDLDALVKGVDGGSTSEAARRLAFTLWLTDHLGR
jgi:DNA polymerase III delta subunit